MTTSESEIIQEIHELKTFRKGSNRGLQPPKIIPIVLKEEGRALRVEEIIELSGYGLGSVSKTCKQLVKDGKICHNAVSAKGKRAGRRHFEYFIMKEEGIKLFIHRKGGRRGSGGHFVKQIISEEEKTMTLKTNFSHSWKVNWLQFPFSENMKIQVSTFISNQDRTKQIGVSLHLSQYDPVLKLHKFKETIRAYFVEEN